MTGRHWAFAALLVLAFAGTLLESFFFAIDGVCDKHGALYYEVSSGSCVHADSKAPKVPISRGELARAGAPYFLGTWAFIGALFAIIFALRRR